MLAILGVLSLGIAACGGGNSTGQAASVSSAAETVKAENDSVDEPAAETVPELQAEGHEAVHREVPGEDAEHFSSL